MVLPQDCKQHALTRAMHKMLHRTVTHLAFCDTRHQHKKLLQACFTQRLCGVRLYTAVGCTCRCSCTQQDWLKASQ